RELKRLGANIHLGHRANNIAANTDLVVYTSAVKRSDNPEFISAQSRGIRLLRRAEFLGELTAPLKTIAVAGTHGKTTTTAMIAHILLEAGLDPLVSVGASIFELDGKNAHAGGNILAVVEADEYDRSFLALTPYIAVLTTLETEHLDIYSGLGDLQDAFVQFASAGSEQGVIVVNIDEPALRSVLSRFTKKIVTFGVTSEEAKYRATQIHFSGLHTTAEILRSGERIGLLELALPGEHNIKNALAAIAAAESLAIPFEISRDALKDFRGAERRAQVIGETNNILVIDDYAHHPTEIKATLSALRAGYPGRRIVAAFQPHTFTRTKDFAEEFASVLAKFADVLYLTEIYPAREEPIEGVTSQPIFNAALSAGLKNTRYVHLLEELPALVASDIKAGDIVITLGAGSITEQAPKILKRIAARLTNNNSIRPKRNFAVGSH
ncbi:MAG TPA: UDP-N-acetylmuramate--L-alanine ligase, partial [Steroidobacteraceae bacterium]|nr:UDP-N-acetylmuramate--L-alanine ligase [Steroidobacteraceae bacterium]